MAKFRKKPVVIEAVLYDGSFELDFLRGDERVWFDGATQTLQIGTLEGTMTARIGDYIIRGVQGELYPCKPDIFEQTYEPVENND